MKVTRVCQKKKRKKAHQNQWDHVKRSHAVMEITFSSKGLKFQCLIIEQLEWNIVIQQAIPMLGQNGWTSVQDRSISKPETEPLTRIQCRSLITNTGIIMFMQLRLLCSVSIDGKRRKGNKMDCQMKRTSIKFTILSFHHFGSQYFLSLSIFSQSKCSIDAQTIWINCSPQQDELLLLFSLTSYFSCCKDI